MDFLNKSSVLVLNSLFLAIGTLSPKKSLIALNSSSEQNITVARAINVVYRKNEDGSLNLNELDYWEPLQFSEWIKLAPRPEIDQIIRTPRIELRCPSIIVTSFSKMPMRKIRMSKGTLYDLQKGICGYSGEKISMKRGNIEHKKARSHGGKDTFENCLFVKTEINAKRGNRPLEELGLHPLFAHKTPLPVPAHHTIKSCLHPDWQWFVNL